MMSSGGSDFERALACLLPLDVAEIGERQFLRPGAGLRPRQNLRAFYVIEDLDDVFGRQNVDVLARPCCFGSRGLGADQPHVAPVGGNRSRQHAGDRLDAAVERQLAHHHIAREEILRDDAQGGENGKNDGKIVVTTLLRQIGGREIDDKPFAGQRQTDRMKRRPHPLAAFGHCLVAQPHDAELHEPRDELRLHVDRHRLDPLERNRRSPRCHGACPR